VSVVSDMKADARVAKKLRLPWWGVLCCIAAGMPIAWLFDHFGKLNLALPTFNGVGILAVAVAVKWKLRQRLWFWITMIVIAGLHVLLILSVPWTDKRVPASALVPFGLADLWVILTIISVARQIMETPGAVDG
jgi:hypothetical protein